MAVLKFACSTFVRHASCCLLHCRGLSRTDLPMRSVLWRSALRNQQVLHIRRHTDCAAWIHSRYGFTLKRLVAWCISLSVCTAPFIGAYGTLLWFTTRVDGRPPAAAAGGGSDAAHKPHPAWAGEMLGKRKSAVTSDTAEQKNATIARSRLAGCKLHRGCHSPALCNEHTTAHGKTSNGIEEHISCASSVDSTSNIDHANSGHSGEMLDRQPCDGKTGEGVRVVHTLQQQSAVVITGLFSLDLARL
jgi:hypothetical protein